MNERSRASDEHLMRDVSRGNREALSVLMRRYANSVLTFLRRASGNHHQSEELFQEVFLAVWTSRDAYHYPRPFKSWLFGIAANKFRAASRKALQRPFALNQRRLESVTVGGPSPEDAAILTETAALVEEAVSLRVIRST